MQYRYYICYGGHIAKWWLLFSVKLKMLQMKNDFLIEKFGDRTICLKGVGKMFYQEGFPISIAVSELKKKGIEVSFLHIIEEFWDNGWSWKTIEMKLRGELEEDIDKALQIDMDYLMSFYACLEQPRRKNGGYEESREMIFQYLFGSPTDDVRTNKNKEPLNWLGAVLQ